MNVRRIAIFMAFILLAIPAETIANSYEKMNENFVKGINNGKTLYVGGDGPNNYSSIQEAINAAENGDTIFVYSGIYHENVVIKKSVRVVGENKNTTIMMGENLARM